MTILFMGGDMSSMETTGVAGDITGISFYGDIPFTGLGVRSDGGNAEYAETPAWAAESEIWLHGIFKDFEQPFQIMNGNDVIGKITKSGGVYTFSYLSALNTFTPIGTTFTLPSTTSWFYLDIHFKTGASGAAAVYLNGVERMAEASAAITYSADITSVRFPAEGNGDNDFGGVIVATEPTIGWRLARLIPAGNGANTAWVGDYASVDETTLNEADYIYSGTADQVETYTISTFPTSLTGYVPRAVAVSARARRGSSGPQNFQLALRSGSTTYFSGTKALGLGYSGFEHVWEQNPDTTADWTLSQLSALQIGVKSIA